MAVTMLNATDVVPWLFGSSSKCPKALFSEDFDFTRFEHFPWGIKGS